MSDENSKADSVQPIKKLKQKKKLNFQKQKTELIDIQKIKLEPMDIKQMKIEQIDPDYGNTPEHFQTEPFDADRLVYMKIEPPDYDAEIRNEYNPNNGDVTQNTNYEYSWWNDERQSQHATLQNFSASNVQIKTEPLDTSPMIPAEFEFTIPNQSSSPPAQDFRNWPSPPPAIAIYPQFSDDNFAEIIVPPPSEENVPNLRRAKKRRSKRLTSSFRAVAVAQKNRGGKYKKLKKKF